LFLQNTQYPRNAFKKDAIANGDYTSIQDKEGAQMYFKKVIKTVISNSVRASVKQFNKALIHKKQRVVADRFNNTDSIEEAAEILSSLKKGRGDIEVFLKNIQDFKSADTLEKIKLINAGEHNNSPLFSDKNPEKTVALQNGLSQKKIFNLWRSCCKKNDFIDEEAFFAYFSNFQHKREWWNNYFDERGEPKVKQSEATRENRRGKKAAWRKRRAANKMQV